MKRADLPIDAVLPELVASMRESSALVLRAATGAGKTTRVPPALLDAGLDAGRQIIVVQPRRIAARAAAYRMAEERGSTVGSEFGYQFRFERKSSARTRILCVTEGILLRMLQENPLLEHVGIVIFDEFHERSLSSDLALAMVRRVQSEVRPDLKIVVMSATLNAEPIATYLANCPVLASEGRTFPVDVQYLPHATRQPAHELAAAGVARVLGESSGDILVFLPGQGEIRRTEVLLSGLADSNSLALLQLYGDMPIEQQHTVLASATKRKVVLATNVAETSVTIPGVTAVVDTGLARVLQSDSTLGLNRLEVVRISKASADQRAGRAGRTAPGICLRLWTSREHHGLADHLLPEIQRLDLAAAVLQLVGWGENDLDAFPWYERPPAVAIERAQGLLQQLGALSSRGITELGSAMVQLPLEPRLARLVLEGARLGHLKRAALAAAILSERDPFRSHQPCVRSNKRQSNSDVLDRVVALEEFEAFGTREFELGTLNTGAARAILRAKDQLVRLARGVHVPLIDRDSNEDDALRQALLTAFPDRVARRRGTDCSRAVMAGGRGVRLHEQSAVTDADLFVCVEIEEVGGSEALVRQASAIEREWLPHNQVISTTEIKFDPERQRVIAVRQTRFADLVIEESPTSMPAGSDAAELLAAEAAARLSLTDLLDDAARSYIMRINCLRDWMPELELPVINQGTFAQLLPNWCLGCTSFEELRKRPALGSIKSLLDSRQLQAVEREAPERLPVPSGSYIALKYELGKRPILAVRIQEVFGLKQTPRIAGGRVPVLLHLLAPNMRLQQVTDDLESFWKNTYAQVRKDLRRRYPKHAWPEDPHMAIAERRPGRKH